MAGMGWFRRDRDGRQPDPAAAPAGGGRQDRETLVRLLAGIGAAGDTPLAWAAVRVLADRPALIVTLDEHHRRDVRYESRYHATGPVAATLAASHSDGRVRE